MKQLYSVKLLTVFCFASWNIAQATCQSTLVKFNEYQPPSTKPEAPENGTTSSLPIVEGDRTITAYLRCDGDIVNVPQVTTMHFLESRNGKTCYHDRACGNLKSWSVYVGVSGAWDWYNASTDFFEGSGFNDFKAKTKWKNGVVQVDLAVEFGKIDRYCKVLSEEICL